MKKIIFTALAIATLSFVSDTISAQSFAKGDNVIGFGFGIGGNYGLTTSSQSPAIGIMYEKGMSWEAGPGVIGLGGYLGYKSFKYKYDVFNTFYQTKWSYTILGIRSAYHYEFTDHLDTYAGLMLAYNVVSVSDTYPGGYAGASASGIDLSLYLGARYYFSNQWAGFAELGYGIATLHLGVAYKF